MTDKPNRQVRAPNAAAIADWLAAALAQALQRAPEQIDRDSSFHALGVDSMTATEIAGRLEAWLDRPVPLTALFEHPSISRLAGALAAAAKERAKRKSKRMRHATDRKVAAIAVAGIACRFPGAADATAFWRLLVDGMTVAPEALASARRCFAGTAAADGLPPARYLPRIDEFDPEFFGITPAEAPAIDPQQRLLLEVAWQALEDAGIAPSRLAGSNTGVYVGVGYGGYAEQALAAGSFSRHDLQGNAVSFAANRLSYALDLHGPSVAVDTACSSALYALHMAYRDLREGVTDLAIVGGVNLILTAQITKALQCAGVLAADGLCKAFDQSADGYGRAEGCGVVVLERTGSDARSHIAPYAILRGCAVNQDGRSNGLTAPNRQAQEALIEAALADAGVHGNEIDYVECHGTGTALGDPIEISALHSVFAGARKSATPLYLGAVKANVGHAEAAAGMVGLIKTVLALHHGVIPATPGLRDLNPKIELDAAALRIATQSGPWPSTDRLRLAGVSSFSFGGSNVHAILAAYRDEAARAATGRLPLFVLSARTDSALRESARRYAALLRTQPSCELDALCRAVQTGRDTFAHRLAANAIDAHGLADILTAFGAGHDLPAAAVRSNHAVGGAPALSLLCPGEQGDYRGLISELVQFGAFRDALQQTEAALRQAGVDGHAREPSPLAAFALNVALGLFWRALGIESVSIFGLGIGEIAAGHLAGRYDLPTAVQLAIRYSHRSARRAAPNVDGPLICLDARPLGRATGDAVLMRFAQALAELFVGGSAIAWPSLYTGLGERLALPTYPFERQSYWHGSTARAAVPVAPATAPDLQAQLRGLVAELLHCNVETLDGDRTLIELGADSFDLVRLVALVDQRLGRRLNVEDLIEGQPSLHALSARIAAKPARALEAPPQPAPAPTRDVAAESAVADATPVEAPAEIAAVLQRQIDLVSSVVTQQLELLRNLRAPATANPFAEPAANRPGASAPTPLNCKPALGLSFFGVGGAGDGRRDYENIIALAKRADRLGLASLWLPERHFHALGGFSPNPVVLHAALARETARIALRGGSVVLPLHHPVRVAEEWAMLDNLSGGRAGLAAAAGWNADDFILAPENHADSRARMYDALDAIRTLWRGGPYRGRNGRGVVAEVTLFPRPCQPELPVWITVLRDPASFVEAGRRGFGVLTNLIAQSPAELAANIAAYRKARQAAGHAAPGQVVLLLHTYLDDDAARARQDASAPFRDYLESAAGLFPSFVAGRSDAERFNTSSVERDAIIRAAYARYVENCSLIGSVETAAATMQQLGAIGVDEVAAFIDFGVPQAALERTVDRLPMLAQQMALPARPHEPIRVSTNAASGGIGASDEVLPLLSEQVPLWWTAQTEPARMAAFNYLAVLEAPDGVDQNAAAAALRLLLQRHAALRTSFGEERAQTIHAAVATTLGETVLADDAALATWLKEERSRPFDLSCAPLLRVTVARVGASRSYLAIAASHLVSDGTAARVILAEFAAAYEASRRGVVPVLPSPPCYIEYVRRADLDAAVATETLDYWREKFATPPALCDLPTDRARPAKRSFRGACHVAAIPAAERDAIETFAKANNATLLMVLTAGFAALVSRLSGEKDVTLGVELAGRRKPGSERLVAHCSHLALARVDCGSSPTFNDLVAAMRGEILGALRHQDIPWPTLSGIAWPQPLPGRIPPVGAVINLAPPLDLEGPLQARLDLMAHAVSASQFEFALNVLRQADGLRLECFYDTDLFDGATIELLARRWRILLAAAIADPSRALDELDPIDADERRRLLVDFNATRSTGDLDLPYHVLFARQVERSPAEIAALQQERRWTYAELDDQANAVAWQLIDRGIEPGTIVPLFAHRRLEFLAAMLGILKAGGAVMPLSPTDPVERVGRLCGTAGAKLVLVDEELKSRWDWIALTLRVRAPVVLTLEQALAQATAHGEPPQRSSAADLAYVIHTSGSTGMPKGAMVEHRGMVNHIFSKIADCTLGGSDVVAQLSHQCFDVMVWQMLAPLIVGGTVGIISEPQALHPLDAMAAIEAGGITVAEMVPVFIAGMLDVIDEEPARRRMLTRLRWLIATGEALPPALCRRWLAHFPDIPILNAYGPAECSDDVATHVLTRLPTESETVIPIGRPIQNARVYILDGASRLQPIGVAGELCVGGIAVGRGYLNDAERTQASFARDPFSDDADARLYRTGDRARWRADGLLEFLGRFDRQLKVNGVRVEPGEVEAAILCHPAIGQAAVQVVRDEMGGARLIARLKARNGERPSNVELRRLLQTTLPPQLVPSDFQYLDSMPLTQTGKLDRQALDLHEPGGSEGVRWRMGKIWTEILGHRDFGDDDSFFDIGGKSFDALELVSRIRTVFRGNLSVQALLRVPTINGMAGKVEDFLAGREVPID